MSARELHWKSPETVTWVDASSGKTMVRSYPFPLRGAVLLRDGSGIAVVEPGTTVESNDNHVVILNADGKERFRLSVPSRDGNRAIGFDQLYYVGEELTAIVLFVGRDFAYVIDPAAGSYIRSYETR